MGALAHLQDYQTNQTSQTLVRHEAELARLDMGLNTINRLMRAHAVTTADVAILRATLLERGGLTRDEADALFSLECARLITKCEDWGPFFIEAITSHVVWDTRPTGVINESQGEWVVQWADRASSVNGLAVLINVLSEAQRVPLWFLAAVKSRAARNWPGVQSVRDAAKAAADLADCVLARCSAEQPVACA